MYFTTRSTGARAVWHNTFRHGQHGRHAIGVPYVEEHPFGDFAHHPPWLKVDDKQRLPSLYLFRVWALCFEPGQYLSFVIAKIDCEPDQLVRPFDILYQ